LLAAAAAVVVAGAASAFATVREFFFVEVKPSAGGKLTGTRVARAARQDLLRG
jgi:hypothetical protein